MPVPNTNDHIYKPGFVSSAAKLLIPFLKAVLPVGIFTRVYETLYRVNQYRLWVWYSISRFPGFCFSGKKERLKYNLTRALLPYTMGGHLALENAFYMVAAVESENVAGAIVECGVAKGGTASMLALANLRLGAKPRECWFFDSYEGLPDPTSDDFVGGEAGAFIQPLTKGSCLGTIEQVSGLLFDHLELPEGNIHLKKGWFEDTVPACRDSIGPIAVLRLDGDWYESTKVPLETFYPLVSLGGKVIVDDYATCFGSRKAVDEFLLSQKLELKLHSDQRGGVWFTKAEEP